MLKMWHSFYIKTYFHVQTHIFHSLNPALAQVSVWWSVMSTDWL